MTDRNREPPKDELPELTDEETDQIDGAGAVSAVKLDVITTKSSRTIEQEQRD